MKFSIAFLIALFFAAASATPEVTIHSINVLNDDDDWFIDDDAAIDVLDLDNMNLTRVPKEKAFYAVKSTRSGYARTTRVGLTVQKGTSGHIHFKIRLKALTTEYLATLTREFEKKLTFSEKKSLSLLKKRYDGGFSVPWLHSLGIDLDKSVKKIDIEKAWQKQARYNERAQVAKHILDETVAQKIEVHGSLQAHGVSFIPTTVFSFVKIGKIYLTDNSVRLVISEHDGTVVAATKDGKVVPSSDEEIEIVDL